MRSNRRKANKNQMETNKKKTLTVLIILGSTFLHAQDSLGNRSLTMDAAFDLALTNSKQLMIGKRSADRATQTTEIARLDRLPAISAGLDYGYLSNADIWNPSLSKHTTGYLPHPLTSLSVAASMLVFNGDRVNNSIRLARLDQQVALLAFEQEQLDIKFLVAAKYLDICRLLNQREIYLNNARLARRRLQDILAMRRQGMVTLNDELRTRLSISDYELTSRKIADAIIRLNNELNMVLGLPDSTRLIPDSTILQQALHPENLDELLASASRNNHELKIAALQSQAAAVNVKIIRAERLPQISFFASSDLQRPFTYTMPAVDIYYNIWQAGLSVRYDLSSVYRSPRKIKGGMLDLDIARTKDSLQRQEVEVAVKNSFSQYQESRDELGTAQQDLSSAEENYRIVTKKYLNQLALLTDMLDAANTKIEAEIKVTDAGIDIVYNYYQLLKSTGRL
jgi:outer membrane protein